MNSKTKRVTTIGMLCAITYVTMVVGRIPIILFLKYDPSDVIVTLGGFIWGPMTSCIVSVIVATLEMITVSDTGILGCIMNIVQTLSFACTASVIYKKKHTLSGAVIGLASGWLITVVVMLLWNYLVTPLYMGYPREAVVVCCVCVGLEVHIRHKHSCNSFSIHPISLGFTKTHALSIQVGMQRIDNVGGQTLVNQKSENVVAVMSSSLKPYFYFIIRTCAAANLL